MRNDKCDAFNFRFQSVFKSADINDVIHGECFHLYAVFAGAVVVVNQWDVNFDPRWINADSSLVIIT